MRIALLLAALTAAASVTASAAAQTPLGTFAAGLSEPWDIIQLGDDRILVSDRDAREIRAYRPDGTDLGAFATFDGPFGPSGLAELTDGRVLASVRFDVHAFAADGTPLGLFAEGLNNPQGILQLADGRVLVAEFGFNDQGRVTAFDNDGAFLRRFARQLRNPADLAQLDDGRVLVVEFNGEIEVFDTMGTLLGNFAERGVPRAATQLEDGRILVGAIVSPAPDVFAYFRDGLPLEQFAADLAGPYNLLQLKDGRVLVVEIGTGEVEAFGVVPVANEPAPEDRRVSEAFPNPAPAGTPAALAVSLAAPGTVTVAVFSVTGREVSRQNLSLGAGRQSVEIPTAGMAPGVYTVRVSGPGAEAVRRLVVMR